jgi:hypothetical protein
MQRGGEYAKMETGARSSTLTPSQDPTIRRFESGDHAIDEIPSVGGWSERSDIVRGLQGTKHHEVDRWLMEMAHSPPDMMSRDQGEQGGRRRGKRKV